MKKIVYKFVVVEWYDACSSTRWTDSNLLQDSPREGLASIITVGILFSRSKLATRVALNMDISNKSYADIIAIPTKQILKFKVIGHVSVSVDE